MTAYQILLHELAAHGRTTYAALLECYPDVEYDSFVHAVWKARRLGIVAPHAGKGKTRHQWIVAVGCCPLCGREL